MSVCRILSILCIFLIPSSVLASEKHELREKAAVGDQWRVEMEMKLTGELSIKSGEKTISLPLSASALHQFPERVLNVDDTGMPARVARHYEQAKVHITVHGESSNRTLRDDRRFQAAHRIKGETIVYSPVGPLTREELQLTGEHLDVLMITGLLPSEAVAVGDTWPIPNAVAQALTGLDGLTNHDLRGKLETVDSSQARVIVTGAVAGIINGAETKMTVDATYPFDRQAKRLTSLTWKQKEDRDQGPVSPASKTESTVTVKRTAFGTPSEHLTDGVVETAPTEPGVGHLLLMYKDPKGRWEFLYDRSWQTMTQTEQGPVFRLLDRGELIAQLNVVPWTQAKPGQHLTPEELRKHIDESPNFKVDEVVQSGEVPADEGRWIYRISVVGQANDIQTTQSYYAVAGPQGDQVILTFTTDVPQAEKLGGRDLSIVGTVSFPPKK